MAEMSQNDKKNLRVSDIFPHQVGSCPNRVSLIAASVASSDVSNAQAPSVELGRHEGGDHGQAKVESLCFKQLLSSLCLIARSPAFLALNGNPCESVRNEVPRQSPCMVELTV